LMKFAILGTDGDVIELAASARNAGHSIIWLGDIRSEDEAAIRPLAVDSTDRSTDWELLLGQGVVDGVIVGRGAATSELRAEQLKRLVTEAIPLLVVHPILESVLPYYEIDMARRETGAIVQHFNPLAGHEVWTRLGEWVRDGHPTVGTIHQVTCERRATSPSRQAVLAHLARDIEVLATVAGDIRRVSAIGPATSDASFASLQVQMTATNVPSLRWAVGSTAATAPKVQIVLLGERGTVAVRETTGGSEKTQLAMETTGAANEPQELDDASPAAAAIARFSTAITSNNTAERAASSTWEAATRDMEVVDAVELSLQKGRTIEVFQQQLTEKLAFRGTMAAFGCGLLLIAFFAVVIIAILGAAEGIDVRKTASGWSFLLLAALAFFLLLQAVPMLAQKRSSASDSEPASRRDDNN
jgi:predicted dehydrogenase